MGNDKVKWLAKERQWNVRFLWESKDEEEDYNDNRSWSWLLLNTNGSDYYDYCDDDDDDDDDDCNKMMVSFNLSWTHWCSER